MSRLTQKEKKWVERLQKVLRECPSDRIGFYTIGDPSIHLYDNNYEREAYRLLDTGKATDFGPAISDLDAGFEEMIYFPNPVLSTCG